MTRVYIQKLRYPNKKFPTLMKYPKFLELIELVFSKGWGYNSVVKCLPGRIKMMGKILSIANQFLKYGTAVSFWFLLLS